MPVYIDDPDCYEKICNVEPDGYKDLDMGLTSYAYVKKHWKTAYNPRVDIIYGWWGYNRYGVMEDGEVVFIEVQAMSPEFVEKARKEGFRII